MRKSILIIGGTSDIGGAIARAYAAAGDDVVLSVRDLVAGKQKARDLCIRYNIDAEARIFDILDLPAHQTFLAALPRLPDTVVCAAGLMLDQKLCEADPAKADLVMRTNYSASAHLLGIVASSMAARGHGTIIGISSVAGDRGRASNYTYGSAKAGFTAFLSGLRCRMRRENVQVITIKPGFVRTRMTHGMKLPPLVTAAPEEVGRAVLQAERNRRNVIYVRPVWRLIMLIIRLIPEALFKRLSL